MLRVAVIGSRDYKDPKLVTGYLMRLLSMVPNFLVITGGTRGVDKIAEKWCLQYTIPCEVIRPIDEKDKKSYLFRNIEIISRCDLIYAFWDGKSRGTKFVIDYAKARGKYIKVIR